MSEQTMEQVLFDGAGQEAAVANTPTPGDMVVETEAVATGDVEAEAVVSDDEVKQDQRMVPLPALQEERKKRQELGARLESMERYLQGMQVGQQAGVPAQTAAEDPFADDKIYEDIPGAFRSMEKRMETRFAEAMQVERYSISEETARGVYDDYDEAIQAYAEVAKENPHIASEVHAHSAPAMRAYKLGKKHMKERARPTAEADIEKEIERRVAEAMATVKRGAGASVPQSISGARGAGAVAPQQFSGSSSLDDIFKR